MWILLVRWGRGGGGVGGGVGGKGRGLTCDKLTTHDPGESSVAAK